MIAGDVVEEDAVEGGSLTVQNTSSEVHDEDDNTSNWTTDSVATNFIADGVKMAVTKINMDYDKVKAAITTLGLVASGEQMSYLTLEMTGAGLDSVRFVKDYVCLQRLDIGDNAVEDLRPLSVLPSLLQLKAPRNRITKCLGFEGPTNLTVVDLSHNKISKVDMLKHKFLETLILASNCISNISGLDECRFLSELNLSDNQLTKTTGLSGLTRLKKLNLSSNQLESLESLDTLESLEILNLENNELTTLNGVEELSSLKNINAGHNPIKDLDAMQALCQIPDLTHLNFSGNGIQNVLDYRLAVLYRLQQLTQLDGDSVSAEEKVAAVDLFNPPPQVLAAVDHAMQAAAHFLIEDVGVNASTPASSALPYPIVVLCGPAGDGKRDVLNLLLSTKVRDTSFVSCKSHTTKPPGDEKPENYYHVTQEEFDADVSSGKFFQTCRANGNLYGLSTKAFEKIASAKQIPVICVEFEAVYTLRKTHLRPLYVYVRPEAAVQGDYVLTGSNSGTPATRIHQYESLAKSSKLFDEIIPMSNGHPDSEAVDRIKKLALENLQKTWNSSAGMFN